MGVQGIKIDIFQYEKWNTVFTHVKPIHEGTFKR